METTFYSPGAGKSLEALIRPNTKVPYVESPGSETLEMQDISASSGIAHAHGMAVMADNTWTTPLYPSDCTHLEDSAVSC